MKTINELKAERSALLKRNNEIYALVEKEQRAITEDEIAEVNENVVKRMKLADEMSAFQPLVSWSRIAKTEQPLSFLKDDFQKPLSGVNLI